MTVHVHLLPTLFEPSHLTGGVAVMIDVLRASTTIVTALDHGAAAVIPHATIDACRDAAAAAGGLTGGERGGLAIDGFDFGNSPASYAPARVRGRDVHITTTNGTLAIAAMADAEETLIGAFVNRDAVVDRLRGDARDVHLVCAGTDGQITAEDILLAGAIATDLLDVVRPVDPLSTQLASQFYFATDDIREAVRAGQGGRNLIRLGLDADIDDALAESTLDIVPHLVDGRLTTA